MSRVLLDRATVEENHERFVRRAVAREAVWTVWGRTGPLVVDSEPGNEATEALDADDSGERAAVAPDVYLFFSDAAYARRALAQAWPTCPEYTTRRIALFDFLYRWLPRMAGDGHLAGTNWTGHLAGLEVEPADLQAQLRARLPALVAARYRRALEAAKT